MFFKTALLVLRKDFAIELKSLEVLTTTLFFALSCVLIFAFAFVKEGQAPEDAAAGILWIAIAFSGTLALGRTFERERYGETLRALLLAPAPRPALYVGKLLGMLALLGVAELLLVPLTAFLFQAALFSRPWRHPRVLRGGHALRRDAGARAVARRVAAHPVVSDHYSGDHCRSSRDRGAARVAARRAGRGDVDRHPGGVRRRLRDALVVDV